MNRLRIYLHMMAPCEQPYYLEIEAYGLLVAPDGKSAALMAEDQKTVVARLTLAHGVDKVKYLGKVKDS